MSGEVDSNDIVALKNLWTLTPKRDRQGMLDALTDDCRLPDSPYESYSRAKGIWVRLSGRSREAWRQWTDSQ